MNRASGLSVRRPAASLLPLAAVLLLSADLVAQTDRRVAGTVTDATGGVIVAAEVDLIGETDRRTTTTSDRGTYSFTGLTAGEYRVTVRAPGFLQFEHRYLITLPESAIDVVLEPRVTEHIEVTATAEDVTPVLATQVLSGADLDALPGEPSALLRRLREMAGATGRPRDVTIYVDGFRQTPRLVPKEAIHSIRISPSAFAPEFEEPGRARVEIVTKPGTDAYHGEFRARYNSSDLNARPALAPDRVTAETRDYNGYVGGPIIPGRWSFVVSGGRWQQESSEVVNATVLDPATLAPTVFARDVLTPRTIDNAWIGTNVAISTGHALAVSVNRTRDVAPNQGLGDALDLPERAYSESSDEHLGRVAVTSTPTPRVVNQLRIEAVRTDSRAEAQTDGPAVLVLDAFHAGANQQALFRDREAYTAHVGDDVTVALGPSTIKVGGSLEAIRQVDVDRAGFGGTFVFGSDVERDAAGAPIDSGDPATLLDPLEVYRRTRLGEPGYGPAQFSVVRGDPRTRFWQWWAAWFAQGDWRPGARFSMSYGVRHDVQSHARWQDGLSPRLSAAWAIDGQSRHVIRAAAGLFSLRVPSSVTLDVQRLNGIRQRQLVVTDPSFFPVVPGDDVLDATIRTEATRTVDPDLRTPRILLTTLSYDRRVGSAMTGSVAYTFERGDRLLRSRNVNAPVDGLRPDPDRGAVIQYESSGRSERHELALSFRTDRARRLSVFGTYTLASSRTDTDGPSTLPADSYALGSEMGAGARHARHAGTTGVTLRLPFQVILSAFATFRTGRPFNITTGLDNNGDTLFTDRPAFADADDPGAIVTPFGSFNPRPGAGAAIVPRNHGREPSETRLDLHLSKGIRLGAAGRTLRLGVDVVNALNRSDRSRLNGVLTSPAFGRPTRALAPRRVDLFLGVAF